KILPGELLAQVVTELLQRAADIGLAGPDMHHQLARLQMDGDLKLAQRRRIQTDGRALLLLTNLKVDAIFEQAGELLTPFTGVGGQTERLRLRVGRLRLSHFTGKGGARQYGGRQRFATRWRCGLDARGGAYIAGRRAGLGRVMLTRRDGVQILRRTAGEPGLLLRGFTAYRLRGE